MSANKARAGAGKRQRAAGARRHENASLPESVVERLRDRGWDKTLREHGGRGLTPEIAQEIHKLVENHREDGRGVLIHLGEIHLTRHLGRPEGVSLKEWEDQNKKAAARQHRENAARLRREAEAVKPQLQHYADLEVLGRAAVAESGRRDCEARIARLEAQARVADRHAETLDPHGDVGGRLGEAPRGSDVAPQALGSKGSATEPGVDGTMWPIQAKAARKLGVSRQRVRQLVASGALITNGKKGKLCRIDPASLLTLMPNRNEDREETDEEVEQKFARADVKGDVKGGALSRPRSLGK